MSSRNPSVVATQSQLPFPIRAAGRDYPVDFKELREQVVKDRQPRRSASELLPAAGQASPDEAVDYVESVLRRHLVFADKPNSYKDHDSLYHDFAKSINFVADCRKEFEAAIKSLWRLNTEFHCQDRVKKPARDSFLARHYEILDNIVLPVCEPLDITVGAQVEDMLPGIAEVALRDRLYHAVHRLAVQICDVLDQFTRHGVVGVLQQATPTACNASFFRYTVSQQTSGQRVFFSEPQVLAIHDHAMKIERDIGQIETKITVDKHTRQIAAHQLYLSKSHSYAVDEFDGPIPQDIKRYLRELPEWLRDCARIVGGERRSMRVTLIDMLTEEVETDVDVTTRILHTETLPKACPVVVIGHYVLTGWGAEEDKLEESRQWGRALPVVSGLLVALMCGLIILDGWFGRGLAAMAAAASLVCYLEGNRLRLVSRKQPVRVGKLVLQAIGFLLVITGLATFFQGIVSASLLLKILGVGLWAVLAIAYLVKQTLFS